MTVSTDLQLDRHADALLLAIVEVTGGDLRAAFAVLCSRVTLEDVTGETFEAALARAISAWFGQMVCVYPPVSGDHVSGENGVDGRTV